MLDEEARKRAFENFTPKANPPKSKQQSPPPSVAPVDISAIDSMDAESLRKLIRSVAGAIWGYALMSDEEKAESARLKLYNMGMTATEVHKVVPALDKWFDRTQGKAPQSISMDVSDKRLDKAPIDDLLRLAAMMKEPMLIAPIPKKLDSTDNQ